MLKNNRELSRGIDWIVLMLYIVLCLIGIMSIFATTYRNENIIKGFLAFKTDYGKQLLFLIVSLIFGTIILFTNSKFFTATANLIYFFGMVLLLLVFPFHTEIKGTNSIIRLGGFQIQPAELFKLCVNLALAKYLSQIDTVFSKIKSQLIATAIVVVPAILSIAQNETGLALVFFSFFLVMYREGLPSFILIIGFSLAILVILTLLLDPNVLAIGLTLLAALFIYLLRKQIKRERIILTTIVTIWIVCVGIQRFAVPFIFNNVLKPYQVQRIYATVGKDFTVDTKSLTEEDRKLIEVKKKASSYNVKQSKIAIGSGGLIGKGLLKGTQTRYDFVPEQRTDFIFCTIGEGFGFLGSFFLLAIFAVLLFRIVILAERQRATFSRCFAYGVAAVIFFHVVINIGMTVGIVPVIGITLPFLSYGGTSLLTFSIMIFILLRLDADRQMILR
jgi:rod shape determining protein RodA